jgi:hypothetical protein
VIWLSHFAGIIKLFFIRRKIYPVRSVDRPGLHLQDIDHETNQSIPDNGQIIMAEQRAFRVKTRQGSYDLVASVQPIGRDFLVAIWGGDKPHIGAIAVAQPRPSLKDPALTSATASVICLLGHKEDRLAKATAETLAAHLNTVVTVTAGIHWDNLSESVIQKIIGHSQILVDRILKKIASNLQSRPKG